ncbi:hypothetical protein [Streptomyces hydrogenans]|uniref:hypothetical protein n=1 Tax=Streptomyces hydrogenans TaxID=1873719 RepID=UPI00382F67CB
MTRWIEEAELEAPDGHRWMRLAPDDCPDCTCCSARLCAQAKQQRDPMTGEPGVPCTWLAPSQDFDTVYGCPCTTTLPTPPGNPRQLHGGPQTMTKITHVVSFGSGPTGTVDTPITPPPADIQLDLRRLLLCR